MKRLQIVAITFLLSTIFLMSFNLAATKIVSAASCSGTDCNGRDAVETGCITGAYSVYSSAKDPGSLRESRNNQGTALIRVEVWWSPRCQTNWARAFIVSSNPANKNYTMVVGLHKSNGALISYTEYERDDRSLYGNMHYAPVEHVTACGYLKPSDNVTSWAIVCSKSA